MILLGESGITIICIVDLYKDPTIRDDCNTKYFERHETETGPWCMDFLGQKRHVR